MRGGHRSVLSPRGIHPEIEDLAERRPWVGRQRVRRYRVRLRAARRARRLGRLAAVLLLGAGLAGLAVGGTHLLLTSPRFAVPEVEVSGNSRLTRAEILRASGLAPGVNIFGVDARAVVAALEALPQVRRAEVIRSFPNRLTVMVEERRPFTLVHDGKLHWIDEQGVTLGREARAVPVELPVISGLSAEELGAARQVPSERLARGLALLRMLLRSGSPLTSQISEIDVSRPEGPVLYTVDGIEVRLGAEEWEARIQRLLGVLAQVASSGETVSAVDLRFRDQVVLRAAVR